VNRSSNLYGVVAHTVIPGLGIGTGGLQHDDNNVMTSSF